ncbi:MAG TPA: glycosyltransferase family 2 protein [Terriglobales bacterium]|jgi:glycosyltransferase involved in cell wall biosynthesis|nr:glycosyltransferase family 2 protein [Terriglobales bacterium]
MTAAHNEEQHIEKTLQSIVSQTVLPECWVIISDNSTDRTDQIIEDYAQRYSFIRFLRVERPQGRSFRSKVLALHHGSKLLENAEYDYIGNVDADLSLDPDYFDKLIAKLEQNARLGIAGGFVHEEFHGKFASRRINSVRNVAHAAQLVRRKCYEVIGGYAVLEYGGEDWYAQIRARMEGWEVRSFPELHIFHHRHTGEGNRRLANCIRLGRLDYAFGSDLGFELLKCARRVREQPYLLGAVVRFGSFFWDSICRKSRPVSKEFMKFLREEQRRRMGFSLRISRSKTSPSISEHASETETA